MGLSVEHWGIIYGMVLSTLGIIWHAIRWLGDRPMVAIEFQESFRESIRPIEADFYEKTTLSLVITNKRNSTIRIDSWGVDKPQKGQGPYMSFQGMRSTDGNSGLPALLGPHEKVSVELDNIDCLAVREPKIIYVKDWTGRRWKLGRKETREAISKAKTVVDQNAKRLPGPTELRRSHDAAVSEIDKKRLGS